MDTMHVDPATNRHRGARPAAPGALAVLCALALGGCVTGGARHAGEVGPDGRPSEASLQRIANSTLSSGNASVRFVDGVAYVTGNVKTAIDANAVARALQRVDGVERVEMRLRRGM